MPSDYARIRQDNLTNYGSRVTEYGKLFISLYSDKTHFIYELLQNAEDALARRTRAESNQPFARRVRFHLFPDRLEFRHNGKLFDLADVIGVCGLGEGTKPDDLTQIGKFGIGFKSVYAYTASPEIHSGDEHFRIRNFVHPEAAEVVPIAPDETLFIFPFNKPGISSEKSFADIATRLKELGLHTLLFLPQTEEILWAIDNETSGQYLRSSRPCGPGRRVELLGQANGSDEYEAWLVFERSLEPDRPESLLKVEVAYRFGDDSEEMASLIAQPHATLSAFFPTDKETHLSFLIQGPYRTTPARDNIPFDEDWNRRFIQETATLVADSLSAVRNLGWLDVNFLQALPITPAAFPPASPFRPIYLAVREALKNQALLPTAAGEYIPATRAKLARGSALRQLLSEAQLAALKNEQRTFAWLSDDITVDRTTALRSYCLQELGIEEITPEDLARQFSERFVALQTDEWLSAFYRFLGTQPALWRDGGTSSRSSGLLRSKPFIRLEDGRHVAPFDRNGLPCAYLPAAQSSEYNTVRRTLTTDPEVVEFLKALGLTMPNVVVEVLTFILPKYAVQAVIPLAEHHDHLKKVCDALEVATHSLRQSLIEKIKSTSFVVARNAVTEQVYLQFPRDVYFPTDELQQYFRGNAAIWFLAEECPETIDTADFRTMLETIGVNQQPRLIRVRPDFNHTELSRLRGNGGITAEHKLVDYKMEGLEFFLDQLPAATPDDQACQSLLLWNILLQFEDQQEDFSGLYIWQYYSQRQARFDAAFLNMLRNRAWLPGPDRNLRRPTELSLDTLPESFTRAEWLAAKLQMQPPILSQLAREVGVKAEDLSLALAHPQAFAAFIETLREPPKPVPGTTGGDANSADETPQLPNGEPVTGTQHNIDHRNQPPGSQSGIGPQTNGLGDHAQQSRLLTYVAPPGSTIGSTSEHAEEHARKQQLADLAVKYVIQYEKNHRRVPDEKRPNNKGFDVTSVDPVSGQTRFIEVKATRQNWGAQGVGLTHPEFTTGEALGESYWLYVVERADAPDAHLYLIPNPARQVGEFLFDSGWRGLAIVEDDPVGSEPEIDIY